MIYIGTSGFKFDDWKGHFYPTGLPQKEWFKYYAERFNCLEVNASYYRLFHPAIFYHMAQKVPDDFQFTVKTYKSLTHEVGTDNEADFLAFAASLGALLETDKLGCILGQFPNSFKNTPANQKYLVEFRQRLGELPLVIEFRNRDWLTQPVFDLLREQGMGFCCVDEPQFKTLIPPVAEATSDLGYVRFHGRNYQKWWKSSDSKERYDYLYSREELEEWLPKIGKLAEQTEKTYVFMNNCFQAKAVTNAEQIRELLEESLGGASIT